MRSRTPLSRVFVGHGSGRATVLSPFRPVSDLCSYWWNTSPFRGIGEGTRGGADRFAPAPAIGLPLPGFDVDFLGVGSGQRPGLIGAVAVHHLLPATADDHGSGP